MAPQKRSFVRPNGPGWLGSPACCLGGGPSDGVLVRVVRSASPSRRMSTREGDRLIHSATGEEPVTGCLSARASWLGLSRERHPALCRRPRSTVGGTAITVADATGMGGKALALIQNVLAVGVDGFGPFKGAREIADEHLAQHGSAEVAISRLIVTHQRMVGASGFALGLGGLPALPLMLPTDVVTFYILCGRCAAGVAHLRGHDIDSDEVRSVILLSLLGASGAAVLAELGIELGTKAALAALKALPGRVLIEINKKVGFRLLTKFGQKGVVNIVRFVPLIGGVIGAGVNVAAMYSVGKYAKKNFPPDWDQTAAIT